MLLKEVQSTFVACLLHLISFPVIAGQTCEIDINECVKNPCLNGAICQNSIGSYKCNCKSGYTGRNCETDIDNCKPSKPISFSFSTLWVFSFLLLPWCIQPSLVFHPDPCSNGGFCKDGIDTFTCTCLPGFRGPECEEDINECESNPCKNGANCTDCVNSYTCTCMPGFSGIHCETNTQDCTER